MESKLTNTPVNFNNGHTPVGKTTVLKKDTFVKKWILEFKNWLCERHFKKSNSSSKIVLMLPLEVFCNRAAVRVIPRFVPGQHKRK